MKQVHQHQCALREGEPSEGPWGDEGCFCNSKVPGHDPQPGISVEMVRYKYFMADISCSYNKPTLNQTEVRGQDVQTVLAAVASNPAG